MGKSSMFQSILLGAILVFILVRFMSGFRGEHMDVQTLQREWGAAAGKTGAAILIDVREPGEFASGHVPGAVNIPLGTVVARVDQLRPFPTVYVICRSGNRSGIACGQLAGVIPSGTRLINISGGTSAWVAAGLPLEK